MLRFGGGRGTDASGADPTLPIDELKDAIGHLLKQLVRAEAFTSSERRIAAQVTLLTVELSRAMLRADYESLIDKLKALRFGGDKLPDGAENQLALQVVRGWIGSGQGLVKALNDNAHVPALNRLTAVAKDSIERARDGIAVHMETLTDEVRWIRERGELLALTVSQIGASLVTMAADGPHTRARLVSIQEQIEAANDPLDIERLRKVLLTHTHRLIEEVEDHTRSLEQARDQVSIVALPVQAPTTTSPSLLPPGLIGTGDMLDLALTNHAKTGRPTTLMLISRRSRIGALHISAAIAEARDPKLEAFCRRTGELLVLRAGDTTKANVEAMRKLGAALIQAASVTTMTHAVAAITTWEAGQSFDNAVKKAATSLEQAKPGATVVLV